MAIVRSVRYDRSNGKRVPKKIPAHKKSPSRVQRNSVRGISNPLVSNTDCEKITRKFQTTLMKIKNIINLVAERSKEIGRFTTFRYQCPRIMANSEPESIKPPRINTKMEIRSAFIKCPTIQAVKNIPMIEGTVTIQLSTRGLPHENSVTAKRKNIQTNTTTKKVPFNPINNVSKKPPATVDSAKIRTNR